jgi:hypothetical protein
MADGIFPSVVSKDRDDNAIGNPIFVQISDGVEIIQVNADGSINIGSIIPGVGATDLGKAEDAVHASGDTGVQILAVRNDTLASLVDTDGDYAPLQVDASGALYVAGSFASDNVQVDDAAFTPAVSSVSMSGFFVDETATDSLDEGDGGAARITADRKQLMVLVDATTDSQRLAINASGEAQVDVASHGLTNTNPLPVSKDNSANSETNPIFVKITDTVLSGVEVHDYDTAAAVASDTADNHDYTVTGTTFLLKSVIVAGSGNIKFEVQTGPLASLATVAVGFLTGKEGDTKQLFFDPAIEVPVTSTGTVRIIRTNRQGAATDLYSTIIGNDV